MDIGHVLYPFRIGHSNASEMELVLTHLNNHRQFTAERVEATRPSHFERGRRKIIHQVTRFHPALSGTSHITSSGGRARDMGLSGFFHNLVKRDKAEAPQDLSHENLPVGISPEYYQQFFTESAQRIGNIRDAQQYVMSRRVRRDVDQLCEAANRIVTHCHNDPSGIYYAQDLMVALRLVPQMLYDHDQLRQLSSSADNPEQADLRQNIKEMVAAAGQIERDMAGGVTENLDAHNRTLAGILQKYRPISPDLTPLTTEDSQ